MADHPKVYGTAVVACAFVAGILMTFGSYVDLVQKYQKWRSPGSCSKYSRRGISHVSPMTPIDDTKKQLIDGRSGCTFNGIESTIGNTPLITIRSLSELTGCEILGKAEFMNGAGNSPKDRVALHIIQVAEEAGLLTPNTGDTIYEGTVGSTGISLASLSRAMGYKTHICMPSDQSIEKINLLHHLGARVELVPPAPITSPDHFVNLARRRAIEHAEKAADGSKGFYADQFESKANWMAHFISTGPEIFSQTAGNISAFVAGAGTGGTISGVAAYLKEEMRMKDVQIVLADPEGSGLYNKVKYGVLYAPQEKEGTRRRQQVDSVVEGVGINRFTENFERGRDLIDDAVKVTDDQARHMARWLVEKDGIFVGSSSAVNCVAAIEMALRLRSQDKMVRIVTILCDSGTRHLSKFWKGIADLKQEEHNEMGLLKLLGLHEEGR